MLTLGGSFLIEDSKEISSDTTSWSGLPRCQSCDVRQDQGEGLRETSIKKECRSDLFETKFVNPLFV